MLRSCFGLRAWHPQEWRWKCLAQSAARRRKTQSMQNHCMQNQFRNKWTWNDCRSCSGSCFGTLLLIGCRTFASIIQVICFFLPDKGIGQYWKKTPVLPYRSWYLITMIVPVMNTKTTGAKVKYAIFVQMHLNRFLNHCERQDFWPKVVCKHVFGSAPKQTPSNSTQ